MEFQDERLCASCVQLDLAAVFDPECFDTLPRLDMDSLVTGQYWGTDTPEKALELEKIISAIQLRSSSPELIRHVGSWIPCNSNLSDIKPVCPFCSLLNDMVAHGPDSRELLAFPSHLLYDLADTATSESSGVSVSTNLLIIDRRYLLFADPIGEGYGSLGSTGTRFLQNSSIDYDLFRYWLDICVVQHGNRCGPPDRPPVSKFKLIDCQARRIINAPSDKKYDYVALSYLWGKDTPEPYHYPLLPETLPLVILDAMAFVTKLGLQYLWVDRYCIWQADPEHKMTQINAMDQIYGDAYFTIFACAGEDPSYGLPGVSVTQRENFQLSTVFWGKTLVVNRGHHEQAERISASKWKSRGWTFQEEALSRRRLYVTDYEISFVCSEMTCFEHLAPPLAFTSNEGDHKQHYWNDLNIPHGIGHLISQYSRRKLTEQSDRINAISGVLNEWYRLHPKCFHYWGVPVQGPPTRWRLFQVSLSYAWEFFDILLPDI
ncbi:hypothetical protein CJF32_00006436 [Rutstroemia sp. NJR-2017a WRK4]|nr:hypothetical protein CJF32_00006436 [Rutstroemia sp. NJR-2017a WRK4]